MFDVYKNQSRKRKTNEKKRGKDKAVRISIKKNTPIDKKTDEVMTINENKCDLFKLITDRLVNIFQQRRETLVVNHYAETQSLQHCDKEEADDRMLLHAKDMSKNGLTKLMIVTVDTDVVTIALYAFWNLDIDELWKVFVKRKDKRWQYMYMQSFLERKPVELFFSGTHLQDAIQYCYSQGVIKRQLGKPRMVLERN